MTGERAMAPPMAARPGGGPVRARDPDADRPRVLRLRGEQGRPVGRPVVRGAAPADPQIPRRDIHRRRASGGSWVASAPWRVEAGTGENIRPDNPRPAPEPSCTADRSAQQDAPEKPVGSAERKRTAQQYGTVRLSRPVGSVDYHRPGQPTGSVPASRTHTSYVFYVSLPVVATWPAGGTSRRRARRDRERDQSHPAANRKTAGHPQRRGRHDRRDPAGQRTRAGGPGAQARSPDHRPAHGGMPGWAASPAERQPVPGVVQLPMPQLTTDTTHPNMEGRHDHWT